MAGSIERASAAHPRRGVAPREIEPAVQALAHEIAAAGASERVRLFHLSRWTERVLDWALAYPRFKTQLFRFVDVFPACRDDADVLRHLTEYFAGVEIPRALGVGLDVATHVPFGAAVVTAATRRNITRMARQMIAGATPADALPALERLWRTGEAATVDLLGERTLTERDAATIGQGDNGCLCTGGMSLPAAHRGSASEYRRYLDFAGLFFLPAPRVARGRVESSVRRSRSGSASIPRATGYRSLPG